jgi:transcriptional regulator with XRE-family HTH domain
MILGDNMEQHVGLKIKELRKANKDTLKDLAKKVDYDWSNLSKVERGVYGASVDLLKKIAEEYKVNPNYFFGDGFTKSEGNLIVEETTDPSDLKKKYKFIDDDGLEATEEEILEAIKLIRLLRPKEQRD